MKHFLILCILASFGLMSMDDYSQTRGTIKNTEVILSLDHVFGQEKFAFRKKFQTLFGDTIDFQRFQYYLSNIELTDVSGKKWRESNSYHLIQLKHNQESKLEIILKDVPLKQVNQISFAIGVDKSRNHSGKQNGDLDPGLGMFWTWSQGYIFLKSESYHYQNYPRRKGLIFHIGDDECYRELIFQLEEEPFSRKQSRIQIPVKVDIQKLFGGFKGSSIALKIPKDGSSINVMGGPKSALIADNYAQMFSIVGVKPTVAKP